jgi:hypothetical protein
MNYPQRLVEIIDTFYATHPHLAKGSDAQRRDVMRMIHEQYEHELPPAQRGRWGNKKRAGLSDVDRSKDGSAYLEDDGTVSVWDVQNGTTRERAVNAGDPPSHPHLPAGEATFIRVEPVNHFGTTTPPLEPVDPDDDAVLARLVQLDREWRKANADALALISDLQRKLNAQVTPSLQPMIDRLAALEARPQHTRAVGQIFGRRFTLALE